MASAGLLRIMAVLLLSGGLLSACSSTTTQQVVLADAGLALDLPDDWQTQRADGQTLLFVRPLENGEPVAGAYLLLVRHPQRQGGAADLASYVEFSEQQARQFALDYERMENADTEIAGHAARRQLRHWRGHTRERHELALMWVADGYGYQLTAVSEPRSFGRLRPHYERVIRSLRAG